MTTQSLLWVRKIYKINFINCVQLLYDFCILIEGGHDGNTSSVKSLSSGLKLNVGSGQWSPIANMEVARLDISNSYSRVNYPKSGLNVLLLYRREHACLYIEFEETRGILVTGGKVSLYFYFSF